PSLGMRRCRRSPSLLMTSQRPKAKWSTKSPGSGVGWSTSTSARTGRGTGTGTACDVAERAPPGAPRSLWALALAAADHVVAEAAGLARGVAAAGARGTAGPAGTVAG